MKLASSPLTPYMGVISTPPTPACCKSIRFFLRLGLSTALPIHHQRAQGLLTLFVFGHGETEV